MEQCYFYSRPLVFALDYGASKRLIKYPDRMNYERYCECVRCKKNFGNGYLIKNTPGIKKGGQELNRPC